MSEVEKKKLHYSIENVRSIENMEPVELKPITILVGTNNSGKSSFLRTIPLLRQSINSSSTAPVLWYGDLVDFGTYDSVVRGQENDKDISFCFEVKNMDILSNLDPWYFTFPDFDEFEEDEFTIKTAFESIKFNVTVCNNNGHTIRKKIFLELTSDQIETDDRKIKAEFYFSEHLENKESEYEIYCIKINGANINVHELITNVNKLIGASELLLRDCSLIYDYTSILSTIKIVYTNIVENKKKYYQDDDLIFNILSNIMLNIKGNNNTTHDSQVSAKEALNIIRCPRITKDVFLKITNDSKIENFRKMGKNTDDEKCIELIEILDTLCSLNWVLMAINSAGSIFDDLFKNSLYFGPARTSGERTYRTQELEISEIASDGRNLHMFLESLIDKNLANEFSDWVKQILKIGICVNKEPDTTSKNIDTMRINILNGELKVSVADSGFGISQILPIITQLWILTQKKPNVSSSIFSNNPNNSDMNLIAIEQPELHLHPRHQAMIADAVSHTLKESKLKPKFVIETHSEAFVNRFGDLIEENELNPDDIQILMFSYDVNKAKTTVDTAYFDEEGSMSKNWPYGFFEY